MGNFLLPGVPSALRLSQGCLNRGTWLADSAFPSRMSKRESLPMIQSLPATAIARLLSLFAVASAVCLWQADSAAAQTVYPAVMPGQTVYSGGVSAGSNVIVGPGSAGASASANGVWQHTKTGADVGKHHSVAHGLAVGAGPDGLAVSHSIGGNAAGVGIGHNFNLSIGRGGTHVSSGSVQSSGGNSTIMAGGQVSNRGPSQIFGGSMVGGFGTRTKTRTRAVTLPWRR